MQLAKPYNPSLSSYNFISKQIQYNLFHSTLVNQFLICYSFSQFYGGPLVNQYRWENYLINSEPELDIKTRFPNR